MDTAVEKYLLFKGAGVFLRWWMGLSVGVSEEGWIDE